jgi:hypothetical protein
MDTKKKLAFMQNVYAASIAESVNTYEKLNVLNYVEDANNTRLSQTASIINSQLDIQTPEQVITRIAEVFGYANWKVERKMSGFSAIATSCKLCALCKKSGGATPCMGWCLNLMRAMIAANDFTIDFSVRSTLMDGEYCQVDLRY